MYGDDHLEEIGSCEVAVESLAVVRAAAELSDIAAIRRRGRGPRDQLRPLGPIRGPGSNVGRRGAYRVFYLAVAERGMVFPIAVPAKDQRNAVAERVAILKTELDKGKKS